MRSLFKYSLITFLIYSLSACSLFQTHTDNGNINWKNQQALLNDLNRWSLRGRMIIESPQNKLSANINWKQNNNHYEIRLSGPMGLGSIKLEGSNQAVTVISAKETKTFENLSDAQKFYKIPNIPIQHIRYWALGIPSPSSQISSIETDNKGYLTHFQQDEWRVELNQYSKEENFYLPNKIHASTKQNSRDIHVTVSIFSWTLN